MVQALMSRQGPTRGLAHVALVAIALTAAGCGDDGGGDASETSGGTTTTEGTTTAGPTSSTDASASTTTTTTTDSSGTTTTTTTTGETTMADSGSSDTGNGNEVVLQNDSYMQGDGVSFQTWPHAPDCWASTYDIDAQYYPFEITTVRVGIGGSGETFPFRVGIWEVDNQNTPTQEIDSAEVQITGDMITDIDLAAEGISVPPIADGTFAIVMCHVDHDMLPSIGVDMDGNIDGSNNWVNQMSITDEWISAPDFVAMISGDFILRAVITPQ